MKIDFSKNVLPHILVFATFALIVVMYFRPVFFENKSLSQHDILQWEASAKELIDYRDETGKEGLWAGAMFSGMPAYLVNTQWGNTPIVFIQQLVTLWFPHPVSLILLSLVATYLAFLMFGTRSFIAAAGAISYSFSSYIIIGLSAGHNSRIGAIAMVPMIIGGIHYAYKKNKLLGLAATATALAIQLRFNHLQITYYTLLIVAVYAILQLIDAYRNKEIKPFLTTSAMLAIAAVLALGTFLGTFWATYEYSKYSIRGKSELTSSQGADQGSDGLSREYAFRYSSGIWESMTLFIPNFFGGSSGDIIANDRDSETFNALRRAQDQQQANQLARYSGAYWGDQPYTSPYYAGAIAVFLFVIGFMYADKTLRNWLLITLAIGLVLSWGKNLASVNYLLFDILPGYNKFRSVTFAILISIFALNLLGFLGLEKILDEQWNEATRKKLLTALAVAGGTCLLLIIGGGMMSFEGQYDDQFPKWFANALQADRLSLLRSDAIRSLAFVLVSAVLIWTVLTKKLSAKVVAPLFVFFVLVDHWFVDKRYLNDDNFQRNPRQAQFQVTEADQAILADNEKNFRVFYLPDPWNEARPSYFHHSIGGYHGAKMRRYQDLIERCLTTETQTMIQGLQAGNTDMSTYGTINMLNTKYLLASYNANGVIPNPDRNGSAWLVRELVPVNSADEEIETLCGLDTKTKAVIDVSRFPVNTTSFSTAGSVSLDDVRPDYLKYSAELDASSFIVFSEIYYPKGWRAFIDGNEVSILNVNYVLRGLQLEAGDHTIEFKFEPKAYYVGNTAMVASSYLLVLLLIGSIGWTIRQNTTAETGNS